MRDFTSPPIGNDYEFYRRQRSFNGFPQFSAPIYVLNIRTKAADWYTEGGMFSSPSGLSVAAVLGQGGVRLPFAPWEPSDLRLPEGF